MLRSGDNVFVEIEPWFGCPWIVSTAVDFDAEDGVD